MTATTVATEPEPEGTARVVGGYVLDERIGAGAMGVVWRAHRANDGVTVAVKLLRDELVRDPKMVARFTQEAEAMLDVSGPRVATLLDAIVEDDVLALVTEYVPGGDLRGWLVAHGARPAAEAAALTVQVLDGLASVHAAGIVHRDVKPENILIREATGPRVQLVLTDFGVARLADQSTITQGVIGTPRYLAPEVAANERATPAADLYAAGIILYELLAGAPPFRGEHLMAVILAHAQEPPPPLPHCPPQLWRFLERLLAKKPGSRPWPAAVARDELAAMVANLSDRVPAAILHDQLASRMRYITEEFRRRLRLAGVDGATADQLATQTTVVDALPVAEALVDGGTEYPTYLGRRGAEPSYGRIAPWAEVPTRVRDHKIIPVPDRPPPLQVPSGPPIGPPTPQGMPASDPRPAAWPHAAVAGCVVLVLLLGAIAAIVLNRGPDAETATDDGADSSDDTTASTTPATAPATPPPSDPAADTGDVQSTFAGEIYTNTPGGVDHDDADCLAQTVIGVVGESAVVAAGYSPSAIYGGTSSDQDADIATTAYGCTSGAADSALADEAGGYWPDAWNPGSGNGDDASESASPATQPPTTAAAPAPAAAAAGDCIQVTTGGDFVGTDSCSGGAAPYRVNQVVPSGSDCAQSHSSISSGDYRLCIDVFLNVQYCYTLWPDMQGYITPASACRTAGTITVVDVVGGTTDPNACTNQYERNRYYTWNNPTVIFCVMQY